MLYSLFSKEYKATFTLALPLIAAQLAQMGLEFVDTIMIGHLGKTELASAALSGASFISVLVFFIGILTAISVSIARHLGAKQENKISRDLFHGLILAILISIPAISLIFFIPDLFSAMGQEVELIDFSKQYLHAVVWGVPGFLIYMALREFTTALLFPRVVMWISLAVIPINIFLNTVFIYGKWGLPAMGIAGAGYATAILNWLMPLAILGFIFSKKILRDYFISMKNQTLHWPSLQSLLSLGWPVGVMLCFEVGLFSLTAMMMGYFGEDSLAAHQVAVQTSGMAFMVMLGISQAVSIRISHAQGRGDLQQGAEIAYSGINLGYLVASFTAFCFFFFPETIAAFFFDVTDPENEEVLYLSAKLLKVAAVFQFFDALQVISNGALRGLKDTFVPMLLGLLSYWLVGLCTGYLLAFVFVWKSIGLWWGLTAGLATSGVLLLRRFRYKIRLNSA